MSIQQLLAQLQNLGLGGGTTQGAGGLSGSDIQQAMGGQYPAIADMLQSNMFQTISPELWKGASISQYSPLFQQKQSSLLGNLFKAGQGKEAKQQYGGFAGAGAQTFAQSQAKDVYGKGMQDVLTQAVGGMSQSQQTIQDIISQWQQTAQQFT